MRHPLSFSRIRFGIRHLFFLVAMLSVGFAWLSMRIRSNNSQTLVVETLNLREEVYATSEPSEGRFSVWLDCFAAGDRTNQVSISETTLDTEWMELLVRIERLHELHIDDCYYAGSAESLSSILGQLRVQNIHLQNVSFAGSITENTLRVPVTCEYFSFARAKSDSITKIALGDAVSLKTVALRKYEIEDELLKNICRFKQLYEVSLKDCVRSPDANLHRFRFEGAIQALSISRKGFAGVRPGFRFSAKTGQNQRGQTESKGSGLLD